jgi:uncharacterized membrane protein
MSFMNIFHFTFIIILLNCETLSLIISHTNLANHTVILIILCPFNICKPQSVSFDSFVYNIVLLFKVQYSFIWCLYLSSIHNYDPLESSNEHSEMK